MLLLSLTPNNLGVRVSGTSDELMALCDAAYDILPENNNDKDSPDIAFGWGLVYEVQQAAQGKRIVYKKQQPVIENSTVMIEKNTYAVDILLPMFMSQLHIVYCYCEDYNFRKNESGWMMRSICEMLVNELATQSEPVYDAAVDWLDETPRFTPDYLLSHIYQVTGRYIEKTDNRLEYIPKMLDDLKQHSDAYNTTMNLALKAAKVNNCHPSQVAFINTQEIFHRLDKGQYPW